MINPDSCINCASCAMACPYGVIRYHEDPLGPPGRTIAVKCDNCSQRLAQGLSPACVSACMTKALTWETLESAMQRQTEALARAMSRGRETPALPAGLTLQRNHRRAQVELPDG
jgi:carbon-monoxide dehydrogenase iron sulfur subunit